jgi:hypothetical protein
MSGNPPQRNRKMISHKTFALMAASAIVLASLSPVVARDTRVDTGRPQIEQPQQSSDSSSREEPQTKPRLRKSTEGLRCTIQNDHGTIAVLAVNGTGATIPAGTVVKFYMQPGNVEKLFTLTSDWPAGTSLPIPLKMTELPANPECSVRLQPVANTPADEPQPEGPKVGEPTPTTDPAPSDGHSPQDISCMVMTGPPPTETWLNFTNVGDSKLPWGTKVYTTMPDGSVHEFTPWLWSPNGDWAVEWPGGFPEGLQCEFAVVFP